MAITLVGRRRSSCRTYIYTSALDNKKGESIHRPGNDAIFLFRFYHGSRSPLGNFLGDFIFIGMDVPFNGHLVL